MKIVVQVNNTFGDHSLMQSQGGALAHTATQTSRGAFSVASL
jgi:hypothetical protein